TESRLRPYHFNYPKRSLAMEEMLNKFIDEGKREHEEMRAFIYDFQTSNELLFKERNNSLIELRFGRWKTTTQDVHDNDTNVLPKEPVVVEPKKPVRSNEVLTHDQPQMTSEPVVQPSKEQLHINLPFIEALAQMPKYAKFLKGLLTNKARQEEACKIIKNERLSIVLLNKLPSKEKDLGSFTIPCDIGQLHIDNALVDLGASISLMPYSMYKKLGLGEPKATRMSLELVDRPTTKDDECYGIDDLDDAINDEAQELMANEEPDSFLSRGLEKSIDQSDLEYCESTSSNEKNRSDSENSIRRINFINMPYPVTQGNRNGNDVKSEHLYSASANKIDEKKPELKNFPQHLEYTYLYGDKSFPIIVSSKLSDKEKISLLQVLERQKEQLLGKYRTLRGSVRHTDSSKYQSLRRIKKRVPSPVLMGLSLTDECRLDYVMLLPLFKDA
ncbi:DNA-directed DNA polymerase, partial [Tanacetum coccineum]